jgi:hypothetical protein
VEERGTLTTLIPCINAAGDTLPPFLIFKGKAPSDADFPENTMLTATKSGYVDRDIFVDFLHHFQRFRAKIDGQKCILIMDGHTSVTSIEAIDFAMKNGIELVCIPPHSSHRLQPLDTHYNGPLKKLWSSKVQQHLSVSENILLTRYEFGCVLSEVWMEMIQGRGLIVDSFAHCGHLQILFHAVILQRPIPFHQPRTQKMKKTQMMMPRLCEL